MSATESDIKSINTSDLNPDDKDLQCAPHLTFNNGSCINLQLLIKMVKAYNKEFPNNKIKENDKTALMAPTKYKKYLINQFKKRLSQCDDQKCWTQQEFVKKMDNKFKKQLTKETFRPIGPQGKFTWLNTTNIDDVMAQYELKYPEFKYLSTVPIDFDKLDYYPLKNINFHKLSEQNKNKIGVVFNLDEHWQNGSHWVALYADFGIGSCYFSDSYALEPEERIAKFAKKIVTFMKNDLGQNPTYEYNKTRNQKGNNACGMYSINFILRLLEGDTFEEIN